MWSKLHAFSGWSLDQADEMPLMILKQPCESYRRKVPLAEYFEHDYSLTLPPTERSVRIDDGNLE